MFMKMTSFAAHNGVKAWLGNCAKKGDDLDLAEKKRMSIVQQFKDPVDELGRLLQTSGRIDRLCVSVQAPKFRITFFEYLLEELLNLGEVGGAACHARIWGNLDSLQLRRWEHLLQLKPRKPREVSHLPPEMDDMYRLLQAIRNYQQLGSVPMPEWLSPMPA
ncbi:MAG: hypothetical protein Q9175_000966 [Cornicularia normoerica]